MRFLDERPGSIAVMSITSDHFTCIVGIRSQESYAGFVVSTKQSHFESIWLATSMLPPQTHVERTSMIYRPLKRCRLGNGQTTFGDVVFKQRVLLA